MNYLSTLANRYLIIGVVAAGSLGCDSHFAYHFQLTDPGAQAATDGGSALEDPDCKAEIQFIHDAAVFKLTNKTDEVLQVEWAQITLDLGGGIVDTPRPDVDLGWVAPGATITARLVPIALPQTLVGVSRFRNGHVELDVPVIVRHEARTFHFHFATSVREL